MSGFSPIGDSLSARDSKLSKPEPSGSSERFDMFFHGALEEHVSEELEHFGFSDEEHYVEDDSYLSNGLVKHKKGKVPHYRFNVPEME